MQAGQLRHRVTIQKPVRTESATSGEVAVTGRDVATVWARVSPISSREFQQYARNDETVSHLVTMRYTDAVARDCWLMFGTRRLNVIGIVNVDERDRELRLTCSEVQ